MPEIKNIFRQGIMNKDDDERLIPNGQYRDALNIEVATSEDSEVGTVQNILGNTLVGEDKADASTVFGSYGVDLKCVASIADEKNDVLYYYLWSQQTNYIIEYSNDGVETLVFVDKNNVLKFNPDNIITGINIIDNLLFWTDNESEPKKINIDLCKQGTTNINTHTRLIVNGVDEGNIKEENITVIRKKPEVAPSVAFVETAIQPVFILENLDLFQDIVGDDIKTDANILPEIQVGANNPSPFSIGDKVYLSSEGTSGSLPSNAQIEGEVTDVLPVPSGFRYRIEIKNISPGNAGLFNDNIIRNYNIIKDTDYKAIFEKDFIRFAIRYKYQDGEYSAFSPFTQPVFLAGSFGFHPTKDPYNLGMENKITNVRLQDLVHPNIPKDVIQIDILFKKERSTTIYSIESIKPNDPSDAGSENYWNDSSYVTQTILDTSYGYNANGVLPINTLNHINYDYNKKGAYEITTENIYAALPANQILRPYDNVPRKALAQEITGNRLVYANYLQNYNFLNDSGEVIKPDITVSKENRSSEDSLPNFVNSRGLPSIKSVRKYYLGVVFGDEYGRETPVFTSKDASINIPYDNDETVGFDNNANKSLMLSAKMNFLPNNQNPPSWASYFKYYIKQTTGEYYNLVLDRVYKSEIDETFWLSFPSSDRNKIKEGDYFTIKKQVDLEQMVPEENKVKIIDIKGEAPDTVKFKFELIGKVDSNELLNAPSGNNPASGPAMGFGLFPNSTHVGPRPGSKKFFLRKTHWINYSHPDLTEALTPSDRLAVRFFITESGVKIYSQKYFVIAYSSETYVNTDVYSFALKEPIKQKDGWIINTSSGSSSQAINVAQGLGVEIYKREEKDAQEFEGRFFVKVIANDLTRKYLATSVQDLYAYEVLSVAKTFKLADQSGAVSIRSGTSEGIYLSDLFNATNTTGNVLTNTEALWDAATVFDGSSGSSDGWFVDAANFVALSSPEPNTYSGVDAWDSGIMDIGEPLRREIFGLGLLGSPKVQHVVNGWEGIIGSGAELDGAYKEGTSTNTNTGLNYPGPLGPRVILKDSRPRQIDEALFDTLSTAAQAGTSIMMGPNQNGQEFTYFPIIPPGSAGANLGTYDLNLIKLKTPGQLIQDWIYKFKPNGGYWMHYSFACPGVDLHNGNFDAFENWLTTNCNQPDSNKSKQELVEALFTYGLDRIKASGIYLEHNTSLNQTFGNGGSAVNYSFPEKWTQVYTTPPPLTNATAEDQANSAFDVGYNDQSQTAHEVNMLNKKSFQFAGDDQNVYNIISCDKLHVYNHTSWQPYLEHDYADGTNDLSTGTGPNLSGNSSYLGIANILGNNVKFPKSVAGAFDFLVQKLKTEGFNSILNNDPFAWENFKDTIVNFGKANNRRVTFILQLDKDPRDGLVNPYDFTATSSTDLRFIDNKIDLENNIPTSPAIFETEAKEDVDLNVYYEASNAVPIELKDSGDLEGNLLAPIGTKIFCEPNNYNVLNAQNAVFPELDFYPRVAGWDGKELKINNPGLRDFSEPSTIVDQNGVFAGKLIKFYRNDNSYTSAIIDAVTQVQGNYVTRVRIRKQIFERRVGLPWYNCFSFGNGVESNRIRDDFNETFILNGVKASTVLEEQYEEDRRKYGLIYSGLYNSTSGVNNLNQFIQAEKITKDINPTFGSIQKLYSRTKDLVTLCEDKILQIFVDRDLLFNADGNTNLLASNRFLGTVQPFRGKFGISTNPESFAAESFRAYFTDKQRGAVLRLSIDGLTPISEAGMSDWFRDNLVKTDVLYGSYDSYNGDYNLTLRNKHNINIITSSDDDIGYDDGGSSGIAGGEKILKPGEEITVSFSEKAKGWVSFKSFIPEISVSAVKQYYTFKNGQIWKHHTNEIRNDFYGEKYDSTVTPVLNSNPELVKNFNTLNYEGSQAKIDKFTTLTVDGVDFNDGNYYNLLNKNGWYVKEIFTDKQQGTVNEFIEKEGKWFNYIKGLQNQVDTSAFNFQGLGIVNSIIQD